MDLSLVSICIVMGRSRGRLIVRASHDVWKPSAQKALRPTQAFARCSAKSNMSSFSRRSHAGRSAYLLLECMEIVSCDWLRHKVIYFRPPTVKIIMASNADILLRSRPLAHNVRTTRLSWRRWRSGENNSDTAQTLSMHMETRLY